MRNGFGVMVFIFASVVLAFGEDTTGTLRGTVVDQEGAAIPKTIVIPIGREASTDQPSAETDNTGGFAVKLAPGEYMLEAVRTGFKLSIIPSVHIAGNEITSLGPVELEVGDVEDCGLSGGGPKTRIESFQRSSGRGLTGTLEGRVQMYSNPHKGKTRGVPGAEVQLLCRNGAVCAATTTDQYGDFRFDGLAAGDFSLRIRRQGYYPVDGVSIRVGIGLELDYSPLTTEPCDDRKCDPSEHQKRKERETKEFLPKNPGFICL